MTDKPVAKWAIPMPISDAMLARMAAERVAADRILNSSPEDRNRRAAEARAWRERVRSAVESVPLTLDGLLEKLRFSREYAEHLMQPYCDCRDGYDGWERCPHAFDLEIER